jgi:hypothetical protein
MTTRLLTALSFAVVSLNVVAQKAYYAPSPPPIVYNYDKPKASSDAADLAQAATQFSIGDPTDEEQFHLELINRARADANAEALRLIELAATDPEVNDQFVRAWHVDVDLMKAQFSTNPPVPPLSMNAKLTTAARLHSQYQFDNALQTHTGSGGSTPGQRAQAAGYSFFNLGENVFLNATSVEQGHAAFEVDWGPGPGGMQTPAGHRNTIHNGVFVEVGIGVVKGTKTVNGNESGPQVVTQDFGAPQTSTRYITGVAYYDINGDNFYDLGEGLPGVTVTVDGVAPFAITTTSGGYSIPVPANRTYTVRFNAPGYPESSSSVTVATTNKKLDFKPAYIVPTGTGPATAYTGIDNVYSIAPLPGATGYRARITQLNDLPLEGAEGDLSNLTITTFGDYPFISTTRKASGAQSFHLGHMVNNGTLDPQIILFNADIQVFADARIDFKSLLAFAGDGQVAKFEISENDGASWTTLWSQPGDLSEESQFSNNTVSLAAYAGKRIRARFVFDFVGGDVGVLPPPGDPNFDHTGWFLDDIAFTNARALISGIESPLLTSPQFAFRPSVTGTYQLEFQAINGARSFEYGPAKTVTVQSNPPTVSLFNNITTTATTITMQFALTAGTATSFQVESAASVDGQWGVETAATITPGQGRFTVTVSRNGPMRFYRVLAL